MSTTTRFAIALCLAATPSIISAQSPVSLTGVWVQDNGEATVRVEPCAQGSGWCATVVAEKLQPKDVSRLNQTVVRDMLPKGKQAWAGKYITDGQTLKATAKLLNPNTFTFKVCAFAFLCDTLKFNRAVS